MPNSNAQIDVVSGSLVNHPQCSHGPTLLFSKVVKGKKRRFFACAACRDRKHCNFFLWENERSNFKTGVWKEESKKYLGNINHRKKFIWLNEVRHAPPEKRMYCLQCLDLYTSDLRSKHEGHATLKNITEYQLNHPSELLPPLDDAKKEAQYLFSKPAVEFIVGCVLKLGYKKVICLGTPRIHEHIVNDCQQISSILLDFDRRFHDFFGPLEYCWYNMFNHHFFLKDAEDIFIDFLSSNKDVIVITDPPFGGRIEPIAFTLKVINGKFKTIHNTDNDLPIFWIFPYFMEPQIVHSLPKFKMLDYKVDYDNHPLFQGGPKGRKQGSPVRIFTNISPSVIELPSKGYKYCKLCHRWVAEENKHCNRCNACTSKNGVTYVHCSVCERCVKPSWKHCSSCSRCALVEHKCEILVFTKECYNCKEPGHKKSECPQLLSSGSQKRKKVKKDCNNKNSIKKSRR